MENIEKIIDFQDEINKLMKKYEEVTRMLLGCSIDEIESLVERRTELSLKVTRLDNEIQNLCDTNSSEYKAYKNLCERSELSEEIKVIFDMRQEFNGFVSRIKSMDPEITERITIEKNKLLKKIKKNNSGQNAKAAKFFNAGFSGGDKMFFPENKKRI